jgi:hypothetical protein
MNERIKELAEKASKEAFPLGSMAWMEKFAELLIRECAMVADMNAVEAMGLYGKVLEHFEVEL